MLLCEARLAAPADRTREAAHRALGAEPGPGGTLTLLPPGGFLSQSLRISLADDAGGCRLRVETDPRPRLPYWEWLVGPLTRRAVRRLAGYVVATVEAELEGRPPPPPPRRPGLAPPVAFTQQESSALATACAIAFVAGFGADLFSANVDFVSDSYDASDQAIGVAAAVTRVGVLVSLMATALADRRGRRRILLIAIGGMCGANGLSALAPSLPLFTAGQLLARGFFNAALVITGIIVVEEAPERARAYSLAILALGIGAGGGLAIALLPLADLGGDAWRLSFTASALTALMLPGFARNLGETRRYEQLAARAAPRGRAREVVDPTYGARFGLLVAFAFLIQVFTAPSSQFGNEYLGDERGFSGVDVLAFRAATGGVTGLVGLIVGGRLAESWGRKPVAGGGLVVGIGATMLFFLHTGVTLWVVATVQVFVLAVAAPALGAFDAELFPTEVRGTANALLLVAGVSGSATGLLLAGALSERMSLGGAVAWLGVAPILAAVVLVPRLPEAAFRELDDVSPPEV